MIAATKTVAPGETRRFNLDCRGWLDATESITTATAEVTPQTMPSFNLPVIYVRKGERVVFLTSGGQEGEDYNVTFSVGTSDGQTRQTCVIYRVRESCGGTGGNIIQ